MSGQGMSGISVSLISIFSTLAEPAGTKNLSFADVQESAFFYFLVATIVIIVTLFAFNLMSHLDFAQYYAFADTQWENVNRTAGHKTVRQHSPHVQGQCQRRIRRHCCSGSPGTEDSSAILPINGSIMESPVYSRRSSPSQSPQESPCESPNMTVKNVDYEETNIPDWNTLILHMERRIVGLFCILFDSLCFSRPNLRNSIYKESRQCQSPCSWKVFGDLWVPFSFLCFNVGDTLGRVSAAYETVIKWHFLLLSFTICVHHCSLIVTFKRQKEVIVAPYFNDDLFQFYL